MKNMLYNFDPLKAHFYTVKLGLQGYTIFFLFLLKNVDCGYSFLMSPHNLCFEQKFENMKIFYPKIFNFGGKIFSIFE